MHARQELEALIIKYGQMCGRKNFTPGYSGNISHRFEDNMLITTSGSANEYLEQNEIVLTNLDGKSLEEGKKPSSEKLLHCAIYKKRTDINAIIHVHPPFLSSFASSHIPLEEPIMAENVFYFGAIPLAEYGLPSSMDLVDKTIKFFDEYDAVLMANHGIVIGANSMKDAYLKLELAESYAQVVLNTYSLGGAKRLTDKDVEEINSLKL